jgi:glucose/arabinose dehydrogenase
VLRLNPSGTIPSDNPFTGDARAIYAYGIRNSFGIAFDPVTGDLWDTENGASDFDEINRVFKGFNSGWEKIMGPSSRRGGVPGDLVSLGPAAVYDDPRFSWVAPVAPTDLEFFPTTRLGAQYKNDLFVGTTRGGKVLRFDLTRTRKSLSLVGPLADGVADNSDSAYFAEQDAIVFGNDFGLVSDLFVGPGGLYVVSFTNNAIYRITTNPSGASLPTGLSARTVGVPEPAGAVLAVAALVTLRRVRRA